MIFFFTFDKFKLYLFKPFSSLKIAAVYKMLATGWIWNIFTLTKQHDGALYLQQLKNNHTHYHYLMKYVNVSLCVKNDSDSITPGKNTFLCVIGLY